MYQLIKYLQFLWRSKNEHGVHSPFVFKLITEGMQQRTPIELREHLKAHRKYLYKQDLKIAVEDFGAGSKVFKSNMRSVDRMARIAGMTYSEQLKMARLTSYLKPAKILELGTSLGLGTTAMHLGYPQGQLTTVERCPNTLAEATKGFEKFGLKNITTKNELFTDFLNNCEQKWDLIYLDGGHTKDFTLFTFEQLLPLMHNDSVLIIDDIYWSKDMAAAWEEIKAHPKVKVTIDSYHWGWVFLRKEQERQDFTLRV